MKRWLLSGLVLFSTTAFYIKAQPAVSQSVLAVAGHHFASPELLISSTLGEAIIYGGGNSSYTACQGFQSGQAFVITELIDFDEGLQSVLVYPNPAREQLTIEWKVPGSYTVELHNIMGQCVITQKIADNDKVHIDMTSLPEGLFAISFFSKQNSRRFAGWIAHHF